MTSHQKWETCQANLELCEIYQNTLVTFSAVSALIMLSMTGVYVHKLKKYGFFFYTGMLFFIVNISCTIAQLLLNVSHHYALFTAFYNVLGQLYALQYTILIGILYARLKFIFDNTPLRLSERVNTAFIVFYATAVPSFIFATFLYQNHLSAVSYIAAAITLGIISVLLPGWLIALFIQKLRKVYVKTKDVSVSQGKAGGAVTSHSDDDALVKIVTRTSLLAFTSISISMFTGTVFSLIQFWPNIHYFNFGSFLCNIDVFSNFLSIWLSYKESDAFYATICGVCDKKCHRLWSNCAETESDAETGELDGTRTASASADSGSRARSGKSKKESHEIV